MMFYLHLLFLYFCFVGTFGVDTVKYAAVIFRHGQRTPVEPYPTDPWRNESWWPVRFGELTNTGKMQHFALGQWFRKRYTHLISEQFDPDEVYIKSTDYDRTLMSAQANLAGLYPPTGKAIWNNQLQWQPIPVHSESLLEDKVLSMEKKCDAYDQEMAKFLKSKEYIEGLSKYQKLMDYLTAYTGRKIENYENILDIYSNLYIETLFNFTLPNWTKSVYPEAMIKPSSYAFVINTVTPHFARLRVGPLLSQIVHHMNKVTKFEDPTIKFSMYSAHDITVADTLNALGLFDVKPPVFTATVLIELIFDNSTNRHYVSIYYRNSTEIIEPTLLNIPYCGQKCPLERFKKLYKNLLDVNWEVECSVKFQWFPFSTFYYILFTAILVLMYIGTKEVPAVVGSRINLYSFRSRPSELSVANKSYITEEKVPMC